MLLGAWGCICPYMNVYCHLFFSFIFIGVKLTILKYTFPWQLAHSQLFIHHLYRVPKYFHHPKSRPCIHQQSHPILFLPLPSPLLGSHQGLLLSVSMFTYPGDFTYIKSFNKTLLSGFCP